MSALIEMAIQSETLDAKEIAEITGASHRAKQVEWLVLNRWTHHTNRAGEPIVGRFYARLKMAGINPAGIAPSEPWTPNFSQIQ